MTLLTEKRLIARILFVGAAVPFVAHDTSPDALSEVFQLGERSQLHLLTVLTGPVP